MEFIKNIRKDFILSPKYNLMYKTRRLGVNFEQPELKVRIADIAMDGIEFTLSDPKALTGFTDVIVEALAAELKKEASDVKLVINKIIKAWNDSPKEFVFKETSSSKNKVYVRKGFLTSDEYFENVYVFFDKITLHYELSACTGCGSDTYFDKEYFESRLDGLDKWVESQIKEMHTPKFKNRITNYVAKTVIELNFNEVYKYITIPINSAHEASKNNKIPEFPMVFSPDFLNSFLSELDDYLIVDEEIIEAVETEYGVDLSALEDWEISIGHEGDHVHDGQVCEYTATFMSPEGQEYYIFDDHSLMTGWNFHEEQKPSANK